MVCLKAKLMHNDGVCVNIGDTMGNMDIGVRDMFWRFAALLLFALVICWPTGPVSAQSDAELRERVNQGTVSIISGGVTGTYVRIASDLASVLDEGDELRILPIIGKGSVQNITDILYLRGIDIGIVQSDVLSFIKS